MKYLLSILLVLGTYFNLIGQSNSTIDFIIGGESSFRHVTAQFTDIYSIDEALYSGSRTRDTPIFNSRIGASYSKRIGKKHFLKLGVMFSSAGYQQGGSDTTNIKDYFYNPNCPLVVNTSSLFQRNIKRHRFIEIPLMLRFQNGSKDFGVFTEIGVAQAFYLNTKSTLNGSVDSINDIGVTFSKRNPFIGIVSLGLNLKAFEKFQVFSQASFRYFITDLGAARFREHFYNYGLEFGIRRLIN